MAFAIIRATKLETRGNVAGSSSHTLRERPTPNADPSRQQDNRASFKSTEELLARLDARLEGVVQQKGQVQAIEYLVTASPEAFKPGGQLASREARADYFKRAVQFLHQRHGKDNVIGLAIHDDETSPHLVAYAVPRIEVPEQVRKRSVNQKGGGRKTIEEVVPAHARLSTKTFMDGRQKLSQLQSDFTAMVGRHFELQRGVKGSKARHTTVKKWYSRMAEAVAKPVKKLDLLQALLTGKPLPQAEAMATAQRAAQLKLEQRDKAVGVLAKIGQRLKGKDTDLQLREERVKLREQDLERKIKKAGVGRIEQLELELGKERERADGLAERTNELEKQLRPTAAKKDRGLER